MFAPMSMQSLNKRFTFSFTLGQALLGALVLLLATYIGWEIYWWNKIGLYFIKWHTHLLFTALTVGVLLLPVRWMGSKATKQKRLITLFSTCSTFVFLEVFLMLIGWNKTYSETRAGYYRSPFDPEKDNTYHVYHCGDSQTVEAPEFTFSVKYNSLGFLGNEWTTETTKAYRIITLGDSFTEGDGAPMDSAYPALMQNMLGDKFEVLNAGVRGSDPVFGIKNFEDRLLNFQPDVVIQAVSENDVLYDLCIRGGYERFQKDSTVKFNSPPWWEPIYAMSYVSRLFFHAFDYNMATPCGSIKNPAFIASQNEILKNVFDRFEATAAANNTKVLLVFYPTKFEVFRDAYDFDFSAAKKYVEQLPHVSYVDLFPCYRSTIKAGGKKAADYYWKIDGHHNPTGYKMMAECIAAKVLESLGTNDSTLKQVSKLN